MSESRGRSRWRRRRWRRPTSRLLSATSVVALGALGTGVGHLLFYYVMNPIVAGMAVILTGIVLTNLRGVPRRQPAVARDSAAA